MKNHPAAQDLALAGEAAADPAASAADAKPEEAMEQEAAAERKVPSLNCLFVSRPDIRRWLFLQHPY